MRIDWFAEEGEIVVQCECEEDYELMETIYYILYGLTNVD